MDQAEWFGVINGYLGEWRLTLDGPVNRTASSILAPVLTSDGSAAVLKVATCEEERVGNGLMVWRDGEGAARIFKADDNAVLMERLSVHQSLAEMEDASATTVICQVAGRLHANRSKPLPYLVPLSEWFAELEPAAKQFGGVLSKSWSLSRELLDCPRDITVLHGDLHHGNVLDGGERGWLAIDPKGLLGERGYDFANLFCNPSLEVATRPGRLPEQVRVVSEASSLDAVRLRKWILAYAGLSAAWSLRSDEGDTRCALAVAEIAAAELGL